MRLFHLSDLHLGKRFCERSLLEDQKKLLEQIVELVENENPDAVMIAGDIYDRSMPSEEAVALFDDFLYKLSRLNTKVLIISGNHDSGERLAFGGRILISSGIFLSPDFNKANYERILKPVVLNDEFGEVNFYMLPYISPAVVRTAQGSEISGWNEMAESVFSDMHIDSSKRNILIAHQFVTGAQRCESERVYVGGAENIDFEVFDPFDYVALGHLHGNQHIGRSTVRYCGSPMKYSFSEVKHHKSITVVDVREKGDIRISELPLDAPLHDCSEVTGRFDDLLAGEGSDDYVRVILTDEENKVNARNRLRAIYPNIMNVEYENLRLRIGERPAALRDFNKLQPVEMFAEFYKRQLDKELSEQQLKIVTEAFLQAETELKTKED